MRVILGFRGFNQLFVKLVGVFALTVAAAEATANWADPHADTYPKIAGYQLAGNAPWGDPAFREAVAKRHLVIVGMWRDYSVTDQASGRQMDIPAIIEDVRQRAARQGNPDILIFKYSVLNESPDTRSNSSKADQFDQLSSGRGPGGDWWARTASGQNTSSWKGTWATNFTRFVNRDSNGDTYAEWKTERDYRLFLADGTFDGYYMDNVFYRPRFDADWNGDGRNDSPDDPRTRLWLRQGYVDAVERLRELDPSLLVIGNVDGDPRSGEGMLTEPEFRGLMGSLYEYAMGKNFSKEEWAGWGVMMQQYRTTLANSWHEMAIFHVEGPANDYAFMRYALTSALMDDGYFDYGVTGSRERAYWFDEFDANLGRPIDAPPEKAWKQGVYMRRFERGMAIVNPKGNGRQTVSIPPGYRRLTGGQDPSVNNGMPAESVTLNERDGIILLADNPASRPKPPQLVHQQ